MPIAPTHLDTRSYETGKQQPSWTPTQKPSPDLIEQWVKWMPELNMRVDLTLKMSGTRICGDRKVRVRLRDDEDVTATVVRALNRLNRYVLKSDRHERRLSAVAFCERGSLTGRLHSHALIERPAEVSLEEFCRWMQKAWTDQPFGHREMKIEPIRSLTASWFYDAKGGLQGMVYFHKDKVNRGEN